ncbi:MAG: tetratricopeptide repeat protein [Desulfobacula sp.]|nr:tetratricopeptide repeat protein [Desulfobacula sp.]
MKKIIFPILLFFILSGTGVCGTEIELFNKGVDLYKKGQHQQAIDTFSQLISLAPKKIEAYRIRGSAYMKLTQYDLAVKDFGKAATLAPELNGVYSDLGTAWYYSRNYEKALDNYNIEIENGHENHLVYFNRALCLERLGKFDQALEDISTSLKIKPDFYWALCYQGNLLVQKNEYPLAKKSYEAAIKLGGEDPYAKEKLALIQDKIQENQPEQKINATGQAELVAPARLSEPAKHPAPPGAWAIQSGAFRQQANAEKMKKLLEKDGFNARVLMLKDKKEKKWYMVRSGYYSDKETAKKVVPLFKKMGIDSIVRPVDTW